MDDRQLAAWLQQHGGQSGFEDSLIDRPNPDFDPARPESARNPRTRKVPVRVVRAADGASITLERVIAEEQAGVIQGSVQDPVPVYRVHGETPADPRLAKPAAKPAEPPREKDENGRRYIWEPNPDGNGGRWTDVGAAAQSDKPGSLVTRNGKTYIVRPDGSTAETDLPVETKPNSTTTTKVNGVTYTVTVDANGNATAKPIEGLPAEEKPPEKQETANVEGVPHRVVRDAQGNVVRYEPIEVKGQSGLSQAPAWQPRIDQPGLGLFERKEQLRQFYAKKVEEGMSPQEAKAAFERDLKDDYALAQTVVAQVNAGTQNESTIYQGEINQRSQDLTAANSRLSAATTIHTNALNEMSRLAPTAGAPAAKAYRQLLNEAHAYAQRFGGLNTPPRVQPRPGGYLAMPPMTGLMGGQPPAAPQAAQQAPAAVPGALPQPEAVPSPLAPTMDPMGGQTMAARISPAISNTMGGGGTVSDILASLNFDPEAIAAGVEYRASLVNGGPMTPGAMVGM